MSTSIRYLRLYLHRPPQADGSASESGTTASRREAIGYLSQYGDILRVSFDESYIRNPQRPTLSLSFQGADEAATQAHKTTPHYLTWREAVAEMMATPRVTYSFGDKL